MTSWDLTTSKGVSLATLTTISFLGCLLPFSSKLSGSRAFMAAPLVGCNLFSGGIIFGVCLGHMLADAMETLGDVEEDSAFGQFPWASTLFGCGYLLIMATENIAHWLASRKYSSFDFSMQEPLCCSSPVCSTSVEIIQPVDAATSRPRTTSSGDACLEAAVESSSPRLKPQNGSDSPTAQGSNKSDGRLAALVMTAALVLHSVTEAFALGSSNSTSSTSGAPTHSLPLLFSTHTPSVLLLAISLHKGFAAFSLGCSIRQASISRNVKFALAASFVAATPVGVGAGWGLTANLSGPWNAVLQAVASGSLFHVGVHDIVEPCMHSQAIQSRALKFSFVVAGYGSGIFLHIVFVTV